MTEVEILHKMVEQGIAENVNAERRIGKDFPKYSCYFCGHCSDDLQPCGCAFPESFHCKTLRSVCADCRAAHEKIAAHLAQMFGEKIVRRVDSKRSRALRLIRASLDAIEQRYDYGNARSLKRLLAHPDAFEDDAPKFRAGVLDAFRRAKFLNFQALAREIPEQEKIEYQERAAFRAAFRLRF